MFSLGMSYRDIRGHVEGMYCIHASLSGSYILVALGFS